MSNQNQDKSLSIIEQMTTDVNVGIDEVVNVFVSQHETALMDEKKRLSKEITATKQEVSVVEKKVTDAVNSVHKKYLFVNEVTRMGLKSFFNEKNTSVDWEESKGSIRIEIKDIDSTDRYVDSIQKNFTVELNEEDVNQRSQLMEKVSQLTKELQYVMTQIKDISRKERQIRGEISRRKLEASGMQDMFNDDTLKGLIQLDKPDDE